MDEGNEDPDPIFLNLFGRRLRTLRAHRGLTQGQLAARAGMHRTFIGMLERGQRGCNIGRLGALARALDLEPADLMPTLSGAGQMLPP